jgi:hypothetical protein
VADRVIAINGGRTETFEDGWDAYAAAHGNA